MKLQKVIFIICLFLSLLFYSCGPAPSKEKLKKLESIDPNNQTIIFWFQAAPDEVNVILNLIDEFNSTNLHGIRIEGHQWSFYEDLWQRLNGEEEKPDLLWSISDEGRAAPWMDETKDLFPFLMHDVWGLIEEDQRACIDALVVPVGGYLVKADSSWIIPAVPILHDPSLIYYNKEKLAELGFSDFPQTTEDFQKACETAVLKEGVNGFIYPPEARTLITAAYSGGFSHITKDGRFNLNEESLIQSSQFFLSLDRAGVSHPADKKFEGQMEFSSGNYLFSMDAVSGARYYEISIEASGDPFLMGVHPFPVSPGGTLGSWDRFGIILSNDDQKALAAWLFIRWTLSANVQKQLAAATWTIPVNPAGIELLIEDLNLSPVYRAIVESSFSHTIQPFPWSQDSAVLCELISEDFRFNLGIAEKP